MTQERVNFPAAYQLDNGNSARSVQIQPGGRVALVNMALPFGAIRPRTLSVTNVTDDRGTPLSVLNRPILSAMQEGIALRGRVVRVDGSPAIGAPVTLTMHDGSQGLNGCVPNEVRVAQVFTDEAGQFDFDFVLAGVPYAVSATDTTGMSQETLNLLLGSGARDAFGRDNLLELVAGQVDVQNTLLAELGVSAIPQAIAKVEGLDRAVLRDSVSLGSGRVGSEVPVVLRFRGRGTVLGQVLALDGVTPAAQVAVNLFPDPDSRELGRGIFSDSNGRFAFVGVPLGAFSVKAQQAAEQPIIAVGELSRPAEIREITLRLNFTSNVVTRTELRGRVFEADNVTPHGGARVFVGQLSNGRLEHLVSAVDADSGGFWTATGIPVGSYDVVAISVDGKRKGTRSNIAAVADAISYANITLQGLGVVVGKVEMPNGTPVPNALVGGGEVLVRTDANGLFTLTGVPTGQRSISAGLERDEAAGRRFPRIGSASVNVLPGIDNFVVIRFSAVGLIVGTVRNANNEPVPNQTVAMPGGGGFRWVKADAGGRFVIENLSIGDYLLSSPGPPAQDTDTSRLLAALRGESEEEMAAAIGEAFAMFTGASDPFLNGEGQNFRPGTWGFTRTSIRFDGEIVIADIRFLPEGTISGQVLNGQGVPIGARVRLTGIGPLANGAPGTVLRGDTMSDPALGTFSFPGQAMAGHWGLQAASPFYPAVITLSGQTTRENPDATNLVLQFPPVRETDGYLRGTVFNPDGSSAREGVQVQIGTAEHVVETDTNGVFGVGNNREIKIRAGGYTLEAHDPFNGLVGIASVNVGAGLTNIGNVQLLGKGALRVTVLKADASPAGDAEVTVNQGTYPHDHYIGTTDTNGVVQFTNIFEGRYAIDARLATDLTSIYGRAGVIVVPGQTTNAVIALTPIGTIRGVFVKSDLSTPISFAQVALGNIGFATTDADGRFELTGVPIGTYRLTSKDPITGRNGSAIATLTFDGEIKDVRLVEQIQFRGEIFGKVLDAAGTGIVAGVSVTLSTSDPLAPSRTVTTGPDGRFSFPDTLPGSFSLSAIDPVTRFVAHRSGTLPDQTATFEIDIPLVPVASISGTIYRSDGVTPATNTTVFFGGTTVDTDEAGRVSFTRLRLGTYRIRAFSRATGETRSAAETNVTLVAHGAAPEFTLRLSGVGSVSGRVLASDGIAPIVGAEVQLSLHNTLVGSTSETIFSGAGGSYSFDDIPVGTYRLSAESLALAASHNGEITQDGEGDVVDLRLGASGSVIGQLVRADGTTPAGGIDVLLNFTQQSGGAGRAVDRSDTNGMFGMDNIPIGAFRLEAIATLFDGLAYATGSLQTNGEVRDLGQIKLDEDYPHVISVAPADTAAGVGTDTTVELLFNEALASGTINPSGIYLRSPTGTVAAAVQLLADPTNSVPRLVRITPNSRLTSLTTYEVVAIDGERRNASGIITGTGVADLAGRPLLRAFISSFTTADNDPPQVVSIFPSNNAVQIDPRAVMRLSFNEPIRDSNYAFNVIGPAGPIGGTSSFGLNGLVLAFTPTAALEVNAIYTLSVAGITDLAGNAATNQPITATFRTLDTLGPTVATLRVADNRSPVAGGIIPVEALLATNEPGAHVRFTREFEPAGLDTVPPFRANVKLPDQGSTTIRAIATDAFGNDGPIKEFVINVVSNELPVVRLLRGLPASGPIGSGQAFTLLASATDDYSVTNLNVAVSGALVHSTNFFSGVQRTLTFTVPSNAPPSAPLQFRARATDGLGLRSDDAVLDLEIIDQTAPELTILAPTNNALVMPPQPFDLVVASSDNSANHQLELTLTGALTGTQVVSVVTSPNVFTTNIFSISLANAPTNGASFTATLRAIDSASNVTVAARTFRLPDLRPPQLVSTVPTNGAPRQSLWLDDVVFNFDEALAPASVTNNVVVTSTAAEFRVYAVTLANANRRIVISSQPPLVAGATYTNTLLSGITDVAGNPRNDSGVANPLVFTTANILNASPTNGTRIVPGQRLPASVNLEPGLGASFFRFRMNSNAPVDVTVSGSASNATALVPLAIDATSATLAIEAHRSSQPHYPVAAITLNVRPRADDDDGDGMTNGFEADFSFDPFNAGDALSDADGDTLSNLAEQNLGTSPLNPDTDGDGLRDNVDPEPLNPEDALRPVVLTFDIAGIDEHLPISQAYGDRVTNNVMGPFRYGGLNPFAPNIELSYGDSHPALWRTGYGALTNILFEDDDGQGVLTVAFTADAGFVVNLHRFDLSAFTALFSGTNPMVRAVQVLDYNGNTLFETNNARVSRTNFTQFAFSPALSDNALTIRVNALNLGNLNDDIAIDNIRFSQSGAALCGPAALVGFWRGENNGLNSAGTNHGTLHGGVAFAAGLVGSAFNFDGVNDYVDIPSSTQLQPTRQLTIEGWINLPILPGGVGGVFAAKGIDAEAPLDWAFAVQPDGRLRPLVHRGGVWHFFNGNTALSTGAWHHVAMVYDGATLSVYLNGQLDGAQPGTGSIRTSDGSFRIGAYAPVNGTSSKAFFPGLIDELGVYNRALSSNEIASVFAAGASGKCPPGQDTDGDGMPDSFELSHRLNPHANDASLDADSDGLTNLAEFQAGTSPRDADTDDDGLTDAIDPFPRSPNQAPLTGQTPAGPSLAFDGINDFVNFGPWFDYQTFTVAMWIKSGTNQMAYADIIDNNHTDHRSWVAQYLNTGASYGWGGGGVGLVFHLTPGEWQYLVMTRDSSNHLFRVYLDGAPIASTTGAGPLNYDGSQFLRLSAWGGGGRHWNGFVDRLAIWTTAHTAEQIYLSSKEIVGTEAGLAGYWAFDEQNGTVAADRSTNNRPASLGGGNTNASPARVPGLGIASQTVTGNVFHVAIVLAGTDPEGDPITGLITKLPARGRLYQTADGVTRGLPITNAPTVVTDTARRVLYAPPRAVATDDVFQYKLTDGIAQSEAAVRLLTVVRDPASDVDGDGMLDSYEIAHQLDPEINDASLDPDGDSLTNLQEFNLQTNPRLADTDSDGLSDSQEIALQTNPLDPDTDDDGLIDGVDPFPRAVITGVEFAGPNAVTLSEGQTTNIVFRVGAGSAPLLMVDYPATNLPPAFATIVSFNPTNTTTNGIAAVSLDLRPFHDAAGTYVITLRGIAANGDTGVYNLTVTIDDNPQLLVSRWKDPVAGNWNDAARWTDGVPTSSHVAVIDTEGSYTVNLNMPSIAVKGVILNHSNAVIEMTQNTSVDSRCELRAGTLLLNAALAHTFNGGLVSRAHVVVRSAAGGNESHVRGSVLFNRGLFEVQHVASAGAKRFTAPVRNEAGGLFQVNNDVSLHLEGGANLTAAGGNFFLGTNAVLRVVDGTSPPEVLALPNAAILQGAGRIEIYNHNILDLHGRTSVPYTVWLMHGAAQLQSRASHFEVRTGDRLQGIIAVPTVVPNGVEYTQQDGTTWSNLVSVTFGGKLNLNGAATHTFNGGLFNEGHVVVRSVAGGNETHLRGLAVTNRGTFEVQHVASAGAKRFFVPVRNETGGTFQVNEDTSLHLEGGANLTIAAGTFSLATNAVLRVVDGGNPPEVLTLADPAALQGVGRIEIHHNNLLDLGSRTSVPYAIWIMHGNGQLMTGGSHFVVRTGDRLQGIVGAPLLVSNGVEYTQQDNATWSHLVTVAIGGKLNLNGALTHAFNAGLLNEGHVIVRSAPGGNETHLRGGGVTNRGTFEVQHVATAGLKKFFLPVRNEAGGLFQINDDTQLHLEASANLTIAAGTFSLGANAILRLVDGSNPPEVLTLADPALLQGVGRIEVHHNNVLDLGSRTTVPHTVWIMQGNGQLVTTGSHFEVRTGDRMQGIIGAPLRIANGIEYTQQDGTTWANLVRVAPGGILNLNGALTHTFNAGLLNEGHVVVRSVAGGNETHLRGAGVTNRGTFEVQHVASAGLKKFFLAVRNETGGLLEINDNAQLHLEAGANLTITEGTFYLGTNAILRLVDGSNPPEVLTLADPAVLQGVGRIEIHNNNVLNLGTRTNVPYTVWMLSANAQLLTGGTHFEVRSGDRLHGIIAPPVVVLDGIEYTQQDQTVWSNVVRVAFGGKLNLNGALTHTFNAGLLNEGHVVVRSVGGGNQTLLAGTAITNRGIIEVQHVASAGVKRFLLPTWNEMGATFQINDDTQLHLEAQGDLTFAGASLAVGANAVVRFVDSAAPAERLVLGAGTILQGTGTIHFQANNQLLLEADANLGQLKLIFDNASTIAGNFTLSNEPGGAITFNASINMPGSLTIAGTLSAANATVVTINGTLTLESSGVINNSGTIRVGAFVNNGGTINPPTNPPVLITAPLAAPLLTNIEFNSSPMGLQAGGPAAQAVRVSWFGRSGGRFIIEASGDLQHWRQVTAAISEVGPGQYRASVTMPLAGQQFFRVGALK